MATKEWKPNRMEDDYWVKIKKGERYDEVMITNANEISKTRKGYIVATHKLNRIKYFKSKSQALGFAKQYMRTH
ncbi:MAG: hypothetical protein KKF56_05100 [Nanoarchaeota archaeon]|nr:hypothetical protein [Nanoarchaeota archaeon]